EAIHPAVVGDTQQFRPHILLLDAVSDRVMDGVVEPLEKSWPDAKARPIYLTQGGLEGDSFARALERHSDLSRRFFGMGTPSTTVANVKFTSSYNATYSEQLSPALSPGAPYDSFYLLAYAAYAAGDAPLTGSALARGIARLVPPGTSIDVGPARILDA